MLKKMMIIWVMGLVTIVPYSAYYLFFQAERGEYAFLIVLILFWIFGFWSIVSPILTLIKVRRFFKAIEQYRSPQELAQHFNNHFDEKTIVEMIAAESKLPRFVARRLYQHVLVKLKQQSGSSPCPNTDK